MPIAQVNGTAINYRWDGAGDGPVIMLAHSLGFAMRMWDPQVEPLTAAGFRVLRYDHRGHGASAVPDGPYTMEHLADDAVALMDGLGLARVHFCGLSMGGMVGQMLGARHARRLRSLVLCSTSCHMPPKALWDERIATVRNHGLQAVVDATLDRWYTQAGQQRLPEAVARTRRAILGTSVPGFCACCAAIRDMDLRETVRDISIPTLILVGESDEGTPVSAARSIHERIVGSRLEILRDAAHLQNVEQADTFNALLLSFLESHS